MFDIIKFNPWMDDKSLIDIDEIQRVNKKCFEKTQYRVSSLDLARQVHDFDDFVKVHQETRKPYFVYDTETFYKFHPNFDAVFHRETYLKDEDISDVDMMALYHTLGVRAGRKETYKKKIVFYLPEYNDKCLATLSMYNMARAITNVSDKFYTEIINLENNTIDNPVYNRYAMLVDDDCVVVYPFYVTGNPLGLEKVVRWNFDEPSSTEKLTYGFDQLNLAYIKDFPYEKYEKLRALGGTNREIIQLLETGYETIDSFLNDLELTFVKLEG